MNKPDNKPVWKLKHHLVQLIKHDWKELAVYFVAASTLAGIVFVTIDVHGSDNSDHFLWKAFTDIGSGHFVIYLGMLGYWLGLFGLAEVVFVKKKKWLSAQMIDIVVFLLTPSIAFLAMSIPISAAVFCWLGKTKMMFEVPILFFMNLILLIDRKSVV